MENTPQPTQEPNVFGNIPTKKQKILNLLKDKRLIAGIVVALIVAGVGAGFLWGKHAQPVAKENSSVAAKAGTKSVSSLPGLQLDPTKNYGNKYANGILPVGDGKYVTASPKAGYVFACSTYASNLANDGGGAMTRGPWFVANNTGYDINKKVHVQGSVMWQAQFSDNVSGATRTVVSNNLPTHQTGTFPISATDPAYTYDRNPNSIQGQSFTYALSANPAYSATPTCESGQVGVMLTGVALFNALDAGGRDAGAWEVQDSCSGHPQTSGIYHYHTLSSCIKDISVKTVIGFALDGFPITGPQVGTNNILTTADLDECHGITSQIVLDGKTTTMYHYVMTQDFPYSINCFRGTPITPPGQNANAQANRSGPGGQSAPAQRP